MSDHPNDQAADKARGVWFGPVDREEALNAIRSHDLSVVVDYPERGFAGGATRRVIGYVHEIGVAEDDDDRSTVFAISNEEVLLGQGMIYPGALVLDLTAAGWTADRYTAGLDLRFSGGAVVRLIFWHDVSHMTESGDTAPGLGGFHVEIVEDEAGGA